MPEIDYLGHPLPPIGSVWEEASKRRSPSRQVVVESVDRTYAHVRGKRRTRVLLPLTNRFRKVSDGPSA